MLWLAIVLFIVGVVCIGAASNVLGEDDGWGGLVILVGFVLIGISAWQAYTYIYNRGVIAHASGRVTATRIDHGDRVEWKIEAKEEPTNGQR